MLIVKYSPGLATLTEGSLNIRVKSFSYMKVIFFSDKPNSPEIALLIDEAKNRGYDAKLLCPWDVYLPRNPDETDIVHVPSNMFFRNSTYEFLNRYLILKEYKDNGAIIINPLDSLMKYSKAYFTVQASGRGLPHPSTLITENIDRAYEYALELQQEGKSVLLKPLAGSGGIGVVHLFNSKDIENMRQYLSFYSRAYGRGVFYIQEFIENLGYDIRVFVINGEVKGRMKRSNPGDFRYNASHGGIVESYDSSEFDELSVKATEVMGFKIAGVDVLPSIEGTPFISEVNGCPSFKYLNKATKVKIHKEIIDFFEQLKA